MNYKRSIVLVVIGCVLFTVWAVKSVFSPQSIEDSTQIEASRQSNLPEPPLQSEEVKTRAEVAAAIVEEPSVDKKPDRLLVGENDDNAPERKPKNLENPPADESPTLAMVNGKSITVEDVFGISGEIREMKGRMPVEKFNFFLEKEIQRNLVIQTAESKGIVIEEEEKLNLDRRHNDLRSQEKVVDPIGDPEELRAKELRESETMLLQKKLLEDAGIVPPYVGEEQVKSHYAANLPQYGELSENGDQRDLAWQRISLSIRRELARTSQREYEMRRDGFFEDLESSAEIVRFD